jgi:hypothetical protein
MQEVASSPFAPRFSILDIGVRAILALRINDRNRSGFWVKREAFLG